MKQVFLAFVLAGSFSAHAETLTIKCMVNQGAYHADVPMTATIIDGRKATVKYKGKIYKFPLVLHHATEGIFYKKWSAEMRIKDATYLFNLYELKAYSVQEASQGINLKMVRDELSDGYTATTEFNYFNDGCLREL